MQSSASPRIINDLRLVSPILLCFFDEIEKYLSEIPYIFARMGFFHFQYIGK
jgi:hypothetical protein